MYTQLLTEKVAIVEEITQIADSKKDGRMVLVPDNMAEVYIPLKTDITIKGIGSVRSLCLKEGKSYFHMPRRRGMTIELGSESVLLILKINPLFANKIARALKEVAIGIYTLNLSFDERKELLRAFERSNTFISSDIIEDAVEPSADLHDYNYTILNSIEQIKESHGRTSVREIYSNLNVSKSKLEQHFNREVGLTPKEFCKIEKINYFINAYMEEPGQSLTELTYQCGYYDQSHLIKDFKYFLDTSPKKFFTQQ